MIDEIDKAELDFPNNLLQAVNTMNFCIPEPAHQGLGLRAAFFDLGMDSLMAIELRNCPQGQPVPECQLSNTVLFDYPTLAALVGWSWSDRARGAPQEATTTGTSRYAGSRSSVGGFRTATLGRLRTEQDASLGEPGTERVLPPVGMTGFLHEQCDSTSMTRDDIDTSEKLGQPRRSRARPAEFVIVKISYL
jgi:hypothetical protein